MMALVIMSAIIATAQGKYQLIKEGDKYICKGTETSERDDHSTFGSIVLWAMDNANADGGNAMKCDIKQQTVSMTCSAADQNENDKTYNFSLTLGVSSGHIEFLVKDVKCAPKGVLSVFKTVALDKLNLTKKPQNKEYVDKFSVVCDNFMRQTINAILESKLKVTHWDAITEGQVVKGMTPEETKLAMGKPLSVTENSQRTIWNYESGAIVMFENNIVSGVIK